MKQLQQALKGLIARLSTAERTQERRIPVRLPAPPGFFEPPTREDVIGTYRLILGRQPEDEDAINAHLNIPTVAELRLVALRSLEFENLYLKLRPRPSEHPDQSRDRRTQVFIHLLKTGGSSLRLVLESPFDADRICPVRDNNLHRLSVAELGRYDCFSGHFDYSSLRLVPRDRIDVIALLREPKARLLSWYRFLRAHPTTEEFASDGFMQLAQALPAEEFFEREEVVAIPEAFNYYLWVFGCAPSYLGQNRPPRSGAQLDAALALAKRNIHSLTALGITERFDQSVDLICRVLGIAPPQAIRSINITDELAARDRRFSAAEPIVMTPRLAAALDSLTGYDQQIYRFALEEFEARLAAAAR